MDLQKFNQLKTEAIRIQAMAKSKYESAQNLKCQYDEMKLKLENEKKSCITQDLSIATLKEILDRLSQQYITKVVDLLTYALQTIFFDKNYSVEILTSDQRNAKTAELYLVEKTESGDIIKSSFSDAIGGGVISVCGLVLQVYYCNLLNQAPILFLDEQLSQVSQEYTNNLMEFIKELARARDVILVLISHDNRYIPFADKSYQVNDGVVTEVKIDVKG